MDRPPAWHGRRGSQKAAIALEAATRIPFVSPTMLARHDVADRLPLDRADLVTVHDLDVLAAVLDRPRRAAVLFDARELYPDERDHELAFRLLHTARLRRHCRDLFRRCEAVITVSDGIADVYADLTGRRPEVVLSTKPLAERPAPAPRPAGPIRVLYHGGVNGDRSIDELVELATRLDGRFLLDLYLVGAPGDIDPIRRAAQRTDRCRVMDPVAPSRLIEVGAGYDLGLVLYEPRNRNVRYCMPNKLFEYVQSRLAVVCGPIDDAARLVTQHGFGIVVPHTAPSVVADHLNRLERADVDAMRAAAHAAASVLHEGSNRPLVHRIAWEAVERRADARPATEELSASCAS